MAESIIFIVVFALSYFGVEQYRRWSLRRNVLDVPNHRSSHSVPTPRGGGIAIVVLALFVYIAAGLSNPASISWSLVGGALIVSVVSLLDDIFNVSFVWRLLAHSAAAMLVIAELGFITVVDLPMTEIDLDLGIFGAAITFVWIVWVINAYNFMDGIDGIAGVQALVASAGWVVISWSLGNWSNEVFALAIFAATLGFIFHNWQPATIFMGDIGSAFLGFVFAVLPLTLAESSVADEKKLPFFAAAFLWLFLFDSVATFIRRLFKRKRVWTPHREHFYQKMVISGYSHSFVSKIYGLIASTIAIAALVAFYADGYAEIFAVSSMILGPAAVVLIARTKKLLT